MGSPLSNSIDETISSMRSFADYADEYARTAKEVTRVFERLRDLVEEADEAHSNSTMALSAVEDQLGVSAVARLREFLDKDVAANEKDRYDGWLALTKYLGYKTPSDPTALVRK